MKPDEVKPEAQNLSDASKPEHSASDAITKSDDRGADDSVVKENSSGDADAEDGALNLVKVKKCDDENQDVVQTKSNDDPGEPKEEPCDAQSEADAEIKPAKDSTVDKEDDDDTLSESETAIAKDNTLDIPKFTPSDIKQTPPHVTDNEPEGTPLGPLHRDEMDDELLDRSAVASPCPEVGIVYSFLQANELLCIREDFYVGQAHGFSVDFLLTG